MRGSTSFPVWRREALRTTLWIVPTVLVVVVAGLFGMSEEDLKYITSAMLNDGFLKQLRPSLEHRGLRIQPYADHSQGDRYA